MTCQASFAGPYRAVSHYTLPGSQSLAVVCVAPPQSARDGREVLVRLSLDGGRDCEFGRLPTIHVFVLGGSLLLMWSFRATPPFI